MYPEHKYKVRVSPWEHQRRPHGGSGIRDNADPTPTAKVGRDRLLYVGLGIEVELTGRVRDAGLRTYDEPAVSLLLDKFLQPLPSLGCRAEAFL